MKKTIRYKELLWAVAFLLVTALLINFVSDVLRPARTDYGSTWSAYRAEPRDSIDVLYLGSSYAYCDVNPSLVYEASGLTGFVLAGSEQTLPITYYYLKEALKTQHPKAVVLEATGFFFNTYQNYTQINVGYLPFSMNKLEAIFTAAEPALRPGLLFDLSLYHDRWKTVRPADFKKALFPIKADQYKGYTAVDRVWEAPVVHERTLGSAPEETQVLWLNRILTLCTENDILPIVIFAPTYSRCSPAQYAKVGEFVHAAAQNAIFRDWSASFPQLGLDPARHLYDEGHLNKGGAAVFSRALGAFLTEEAGLTPRAQTAENADAWDAAAQYWVGETAPK